MAAKIRETDLYAPVKLLLEGQGYEVKGEIGSADVVGVRGECDCAVGWGVVGVRGVGRCQELRFRIRFGGCGLSMGR